MQSSINGPGLSNPIFRIIIEDDDRNPRIGRRLKVSAKPGSPVESAPFNLADDFRVPREKDQSVN
jgi:hypothetical protein